MHTCTQTGFATKQCLFWEGIRNMGVLKPFCCFQNCPVFPSVRMRGQILHPFPCWQPSSSSLKGQRHKLGMNGDIHAVLHCNRKHKEALYSIKLICQQWSEVVSDCYQSLPLYHLQQQGHTVVSLMKIKQLICKRRGVCCISWLFSGKAIKLPQLIHVAAKARCKHTLILGQCPFISYFITGKK